MYFICSVYAAILFLFKSKNIKQYRKSLFCIYFFQYNREKEKIELKIAALKAECNGKFYKGMCRV